jgi:hypothetical protein
MPQAENLLTPIDDTVEERTFTFDFGKNLLSGVTLTAVTELTCVVVTGADPTPWERILSTPAIVDALPAPLGSGVVDGAVAVLIGTMLGGVTYLLQCVAQTSDGQELSLWQDLPCLTPS